MRRFLGSLRELWLVQLGVESWFSYLLLSRNPSCDFNFLGLRVGLWFFWLFHVGFTIATIGVLHAWSLSLGLLWTWTHKLKSRPLQMRETWISVKLQAKQKWQSKPMCYSEGGFSQKYSYAKRYQAPSPDQSPPLVISIWWIWEQREVFFPNLILCASLMPPFSVCTSSVVP